MRFWLGNLLLAFTLLGVPGPRFAAAQTPYAESCRKSIENADSTQAKFLAQLKLVDALVVDDPRAALALAEDNVEFALAIGDRDFLNTALLDERRVYFQLHNEFPEQPNRVREASDTSAKTGPKDFVLSKDASPELLLHCADASLAIDVWAQDLYASLDERLYILHDALEACSDPELVAYHRVIELYIRGVFRGQRVEKNPELAEVLEKVVAESAKFKEVDGEIVVAVVESGVARRERQYSKALTRLDDAARKSKGNGNLFLRWTSEFSLGIMHQNDKNYHATRVHFRNAREAADKLGSTHLLFTVLVSLADVEGKLGNSKSQLECLETISKGAAFRAMPDGSGGKDRIYRQLSAVHEHLQNERKADIFRSKTVTIDVMSNVRKLKSQNKKLLDDMAFAKRQETLKASAVGKQAVVAVPVQESWTSLWVAAFAGFALLVPFTVLLCFHYRLLKSQREFEESKQLTRESKSECEGLAQRLARMERMESLGLMAGSIAHDFNNILVGVLCNAEVLQLEGSIEDKQFLHQRVNAIVASAEKAANLSSQILTYTGQQFFVTDQVDLNDLVKRFEPALQTTCRGDQELVLKLCDTALPTMVDEPQVQQVLLNLLANAVVASEDNGVIEIGSGLVELGDVAGRPRCTLLAD